jgi:EmrB/QacA subfamily drug resistance transporter
MPGTDTGTAAARRRGGLFGTPAQSVALATLCVVLFLTFLDNTVVSVALSDVQSSLHAGVTELQWVVNGYALAFASFMLAGGVMGDLYGRKRVMLVGVGIFCAGSVVCAVAPNADVLIAGRVVMGLGAAASEPGTLSILRHVYPEKDTRADALGLWAAVSGLALALGPVVGGVLIGVADWRAIFWFNLAIAAVAFVMAVRFVPESADPQKNRRFDIPGLVTGVVALAALSTAIIQGEDSGYRDPPIVGLFALSAVAGVAFLLVERRSRNPLLDLRCLERPPFLGSNVVAFANYFGVFSIFFFTALYLEVVVGASGFAAAIDFAPMALGMILASALTGPWVARVGPRIPMVTGCVLAGVGILLTDAVLNPHVSFATLGWVLPLVGIGFGIALVPVTSAALTVVPPERSGMAASATNTSRELGAVVGVAVLGSLVNAKLTGELAGRLAKIPNLPHSFSSLIIHLVTTGGVQGASPSERHSKNPATQHLINEVTSAAYHAFGSGLHEALVVSGILILAAAVVAAVTIHRPKGETYEL